MHFNLQQSIPILERTPSVIRQLLSGLDSQWTTNNEGPETWSPYDVVGHLVHGEHNDWITRIKITMNDKGGKYVPFNRTAMFEESKGKSLAQLLDEFEGARKHNLEELRILSITEEDLNKTAIHPVFGTVTLRQLLSTWVAHDLSHIVQISRTMAKQYKEEVGPWKEYLSVMK